MASFYAEDTLETPSIAKINRKSGLDTAIFSLIYERTTLYDLPALEREWGVGIFRSKLVGYQFTLTMFQSLDLFIQIYVSA